MYLSSGNPKGGSKTLGNSSQIAYQWYESAVVVDIEYRLDDNMPSYFAQASYGVCMG